MADYTTIDDPSAYFQTALYTGNAGTQTITNDGNSDLQPDFLWFKERSVTGNHQLINTVSGINKKLMSNSTATEGTQTNYVTAIGSDSFSIGNNNGINQNSVTNVCWQWKAGTAASGNTSGSGTAKTFSSSSSSTAGFSIVKYVGNGTSNHAIPHGCGAAPTMVIVKTTTKSSQAWPVDNRQISGVMYLDETGAAGAYGNDNPFTSVAPTSSVFSVGSPGNTNYNDDTYIAYCFAEVKGYSKFGFYIGNGNADGTFIYLGFKPAFLMVKLSSATDDWQILDNKRNPFNIMDKYLRPNSNGSTVTNAVVDFVSNGFKLRSSAGSWNPSGETAIYMAFAENPFVTSTGVPATAR